MYYDFHLHSNFSEDSTSPMEDMIKEGIKQNLKGMCFTEHTDLDFPGNNFTFLADLDAYEKTFLQLKEKYRSQIKLYLGLEVGLQPHLKEEIPALCASRNFDFLIGSTHVADCLDPYDNAFFENRTETQAYQRYFEVLLKNLQTYSCFDTCGHIDYVVRYGPSKNVHYCYKNHADILDEILKTLIDKGIGLECNTAGFKYGLGQPHPSTEILKRYKELGGELLTLGSDAHAPCHIAYDFQKASDLLKACGFRYYTIFKERKSEFIPL